MIIVDEFTGRLMPGRRWSDGLHQAVEAKEGVKIERETRRSPRITFQNYFRMYKKLAGMTGTAETEAAEFEKIYKLEVTVIPTNKPMIRIEYRGHGLSHRRRKIPQRREGNQGAAMRRDSRCWSARSRSKNPRRFEHLKKMGVRHEVLNAKNHEREATSSRRPGRKGAVTVSTNMAGRGTDILLGGNRGVLLEERLQQADKIPDMRLRRSSSEDGLTRLRSRPRSKQEHDEVVALGGLHIIGTERHESRRIDNQLRGRAGRQGDPGQLAFLSLAARRPDAHLRRRRMQNLMLRLGMEEDVPIESQADHQAHRGRAKGRRSAELRLPQTRPRIRRRDEQAAPGRLRHAPQLLEGEDQKERILEIVEALWAVSSTCAARKVRTASTYDWT